MGRSNRPTLRSAQECSADQLLRCTDRGRPVGQQTQQKKPGIVTQLFELQLLRAWRPMCHGSAPWCVPANHMHRERLARVAFAWPCCCASEPQCHSRDRHQLVDGPLFHLRRCGAASSWRLALRDSISAARLKVRLPRCCMDPCCPLPRCVWRSRGPSAWPDVGCEAIGAQPPRCMCRSATG